MTTTLFTRLIDILDALERVTRDVEPLQARYALEDIARRLDALADACIGVDCPAMEDTP